MNFIIKVILIFPFFISFNYAQNQHSYFDVLEVERSLSRISFYENDNKIKKKVFRERVIIDKETQKYFAKGNNLGILNGISKVLVWTSGIALSTSILAGDFDNRNMFIFGGVFLGSAALSLTFATFSEKNYKKAAVLYNQNRNKTSMQSRGIKTELNLGFNQIGFSLKF